MKWAYVLFVVASVTISVQAAPRVAHEEAYHFAAGVLQVFGEIESEAYQPVNPGFLVRWAIEGLYGSFKEPIPKKLQLQLADTTALKRATRLELFNLLRQARQALPPNKQLANGQDVYIAVNGMLHRFDPLARYVSLDESDHCRFLSAEYLSRVGIGIRVRQDPVRKMPRVVTTNYLGGAYHAGLQPGDLIIAIVNPEKGADEPKQPQSTKDLAIAEVYRLLSGREGNTIDLLVEREGKTIPLLITVQRKRWEKETVLGVARNADNSWNYFFDKHGTIAYIKVASFSRNTVKDIEKALDTINRRNASGLILDLRFNTVGVFQVAADTADLFIDDGIICTIPRRDGAPRQYWGKSPGSHLGFPMVVLLNEETTKAAEMFAACLQDHGRALVVGQPTQGNVSIQNLLPVKDSMLTLTTGVFMRPSGQPLYGPDLPKGTDGRGIIPTRDYRLALPYREYEQLRLHLDEREFIPAKGKKHPYTNPDFKDRQLELALKYFSR